MYFQITRLVLWPKRNFSPRFLDFKPGIVNVISGASKTGKSAVIPIIDYCLGSDKCAIPVGVIRDACAWFGIVVQTIEGAKLLARREPGDQQSTGDMLLLEGVDVDVPDRIEEKTTNVETVKVMLDRLSGLPTLDFEPGAEGTFRARPSFRDLMAFTFQPQNIIANPDVMFFKADTTEHREKLKTVFPYVLGAVTANILAARFELDRLQRALRRKETEVANLDAAAVAWKVEAQSWLRQAMELGLVSGSTIIPDDWPAVVDELRRISQESRGPARPSLTGIDVALIRLGELREQESELATRVEEHRQRLNELRRLTESSEVYGDALHVIRDRLAISTWLRSLASASDEVTAALSGDSVERLGTLCDALASVELRLRSHPAMSDLLDKEILRQRAATEQLLEELWNVRGEIQILERSSDSTRRELSAFERTERFIGRVQQALLLYDRADPAAAERQEVIQLRERIRELQETVSDSDVRRKTQSALDRVQALTSKLVPRLDAEWPDAPIRLIIDELTVKVLHGKRDDFLWEVGSGANWLAYHVALTVALQNLFLQEVHHAVPGLLVYDQPSQVYFPKRLASDEVDKDAALRDEDVVAVRKVFSLLGAETTAASGRLQVIALDHAGAEVWGNIEGVELVEEWRDHGLVPVEWLS